MRFVFFQSQNLSQNLKNVKKFIVYYKDSLRLNLHQHKRHNKYQPPINYGFFLWWLIKCLRLLIYQTFDMSDFWYVRLLICQTFDMSDFWNVRLLFFTISLQVYRVFWNKQYQILFLKQLLKKILHIQSWLLKFFKGFKQQFSHQNASKLWALIPVRRCERGDRIEIGNPFRREARGRRPEFRAPASSTRWSEEAESRTGKTNTTKLNRTNRPRGCLKG